MVIDTDWLVDDKSAGSTENEEQWRWTGRCAWILAMIIAVGTLIGALPLTEPLSHCGHFRWQFAVVAFVLAVVAWFLERNCLLALSAAVGLVCAAAVLSWHGAAPSVASRDLVERLSLLVYNVGGADMEQTREYIADQSTDMVALCELDEMWVETLQPVLINYPHRVLDRERRVMLASKLPLAEPALAEPCRRGRAGQIVLGGRAVAVVVVHLGAAIGADKALDRRGQVADLLDNRRHYGQDSILVGDFNTTEWSEDYRRILATWQLRDSRQGFGLQCTWPTWSLLLSLPIDHCFVSQGFHIRSRTVGPNLGGDHYPLVVSLAAIR